MSDNLKAPLCAFFIYKNYETIFLYFYKFIV